MMRYEFSPDSRADRLTAIGRVAVLACSLLAVLLGSSDPMHHAGVVAGSVTGYLVYALAVYLIVRRAEALTEGQRLLTHAIDIVSFSVLIYLTHGTESPFILGFVFTVACATLRWHWRGAMWTGITVVVLFVALSIDAAQGLAPMPLDPNRLLIRTTLLVVLSVVFVYLGAYQSHVREELQKLAAWPSVSGRDLIAVPRETLAYAADILSAPKVVMVWEEPEEPGPRVACWNQGEFRITRERPGVFEPLVAAPLSDSDFVCRDLAARHPDVHHTTRDGVRRWRGVPLHAELTGRFAIRSVVCVRLAGIGRLLFLDKSGVTSDDLRIGQIVALQVMSSVEHVRLLQSLEETAVAAERVRLAHDLHDGVLQSLTAIALQVEAIVRGIETAPQQRLQQMQSRIVDEQRRLRHFIEGLKSPTHTSPEDTAILAARLEALAEQVESDWGLQVKVNASGADRIPAAITHDVFFIVHEALINAARHARASTVQVDVAVPDGRVEIAVADNGHGFSFRGRHDGTALRQMRLGPATLHGRVASLGGNLVIDSSDHGARLEITLPLSEADR